jgi:hypothetical protein
MSKGSKGSGSPSWGGIAGSAINKVLGMMGWGGYMPKPNVPGSWVCMGESAGTTQQLGALWGSQVVPVTGPTPNSVILIESPRFALTHNQAPTIQKFSVQMLDGQIDLGIWNSAWVAGQQATVTIGVGIYIAQNLAGTGIQLYQTQDPLDATQVSRDNWLYLENRRVLYSANLAGGAGYAVNPMVPKLFDVMNPALNAVLEPGEALMMSVNATIGGGDILNLHPAIRGFVSRVG